MKPLMIELSRMSSFLPGTSSSNSARLGSDCKRGVTIESGLETVGNTAIIPVYGYLTKRSSPFAGFFGTTSYEEIAANLREALENPRIEKIILDVDSPGGEVNGVFDLCDEIYAVRTQKQIEAIANDDAFSAAYAIASSAQKLWITRTSGIGSIGVIATHIDQSTFDKNEGIKITPIFAGERKNDLTPHEPLSEAATVAMQGEIDRLYAIFIDTICWNRDISVEHVRKTQAAMLFGHDAINTGFADGFHTLDELLAEQKNTETTFLTTNPRRSKMETETKKPRLTREQQAFDRYMTEPPEDADENDKPEQLDDDEPEFTARVNELIKLCKIAKRPELLANWIDQNLTVTQAQESLLKEMEANDADIISARTAAKSPENPLLQAARNRLNVR
jgi:signal peptide peptidase SppA